MFSEFKMEPGKPHVIVKDQQVTWLDFCFLTWGIVTYIGDISFDIYVASSSWYLFTVGFFITSVLFIIIPSVVNNILSWLWYKEDGTKLTKTDLTLHFMLISPLKRYIQTFRLAIKAYSEKKDEDVQIFLTNYADLALLALLEAFLEAGPQLLLQLSVVIPGSGTGPEIRWYRYVSILFSLISLGCAILSFHKNKRRPQTKKNDIGLIGCVFQFLWHLMITASRVISLTCLLTVFPWWLLAGCIAHVFFFFVYLYLTNKGMRKFQYLFADYGMLLVWSMVSVFAGIPMNDVPTFKFYLIYHIVFFSENLASVLIWYFMMDYWSDAWILLFLSLTFFSLGILFMWVYYQFYHPNKNNLSNAPSKTENAEEHASPVACLAEHA